MAACSGAASPVCPTSKATSHARKFKSYPIGYFHIDIAGVQTAEGKLYLFVAIDRTSEFAFARLVSKAGKVAAAEFLCDLIAAVPYATYTMLTDNVLCREGNGLFGQQVSAREFAPAA